MSASHRIPEAGLKAFGRTALERVGMSAEDAQLSMDVLVEADLRAVHSHGVVRLPIDTERLRAASWPLDRPCPSNAIGRRPVCSTAATGWA